MSEPYPTFWLAMMPAGAGTVWICENCWTESEAEKLMSGKITAEEITRRFTYVKPNENQIPKFHVIRNDAKELAEMINTIVPDCREKSLAMTKLEEVVMWANAAVARHVE